MNDLPIEYLKYLFWFELSNFERKCANLYGETVIKSIILKRLYRNDLITSPTRWLATLTDKGKRLKSTYDLLK